MACAAGPERLKKIKDARSENSDGTDGIERNDDNLNESVKAQAPMTTLFMPEVGAKMRSINADIDAQRAELIGLLVFFD